MTRLVKIELKKLFSKKIIYIFLIVLFGLNVGTTLLEKYVTKILGALDSATTAELYKQSMESYDLDNPEQARYYADDKTTYDTLILAKDYDISSAEYIYVMDDMRTNIACMNESKYVTKDDVAYAECEEKYNEQVAFLKNFDWKKLIENKKEETKEELANVKTLLAMGEISKEDADKQTKVLNLQMDVLEYRLKHEIPIDQSSVSIHLEQYPGAYEAYLDSDKDKNLIEHNDKIMKQEREKEYFISKYKFEHELFQRSKNKTLTGGTTADSILNVFSGGMMSLLFLLLIAGGIIAEEYNKGTIKQLLLKPYTRTKILTSKILTVLITFTLFMFVYALMTGIINGVVFGEFKSILDPVLVYDFNKGKVLEINLFVRCCQLFLAVLPMFLILLGVSVLVGIATTNTSVALIVPLVISIASTIINAFAKGKIFAYLPTMCWNLSEFLDGGLPAFKYLTLVKSISVDAVTIFILFAFAYAIFKRKDIKNQ